MRIGVDLDNTLLGYDRAFLATARDLGLVDAGFDGDRAAVRAAVRASDAGEPGWQWLQGQVYGRALERAELLPGADRFLDRCRDAGHEVVVVSHKTRRGHFDPDGPDLHAAARTLLARRGLFASGRLAPDAVHFETTRAAKLARIDALGPALFIDDLLEVLTDPAFPAQVAPFWIGARGAPPPPVTACRGWDEVEAHVFGR